MRAGMIVPTIENSEVARDIWKQSEVEASSHADGHVSLCLSHVALSEVGLGIRKSSTCPSRHQAAISQRQRNSRSTNPEQLFRPGTRKSPWQFGGTEA